MAYQKTVWKDQDVENPRTYIARDNGDDTITLLDAFGEVTELGTPVNAENMNHIEDGIAEVDSTTVHKTGNETILGEKTFQTDILYKKSTQDFTTTPAQPIYTEIRNVDINNFEIGQIRAWKDTDGANVIDLLGRYQDNSVNFYGATLGIKIYSDGRSFPYASPNDDNGSIVTTTGINKSTNGYVILGNGLIIQWGTLSSGKTITYSRAFTNADSYALVFNNNATTDGYGRGDKIESKSSTSATVNGLCENPIRWLAIGY